MDEKVNITNIALNLVAEPLTEKKVIHIEDAIGFGDDDLARRNSLPFPSLKKRPNFIDKNVSKLLSLFSDFSKELSTPRKLQFSKRLKQQATDHKLIKILKSTRSFILNNTTKLAPTVSNIKNTGSKHSSSESFENEAHGPLEVLLQRTASIRAIKSELNSDSIREVESDSESSEKKLKY